MKKKGGMKNDSEKPDLSLISSIWLFGTARVLTFGKKKYAAHNWRKGIALSRLLAAGLRHYLAFLAGEDYDFDPDCRACQKGTCLNHSGEHHLDCVSCCIMFARETYATRPDLDDRYRIRGFGVLSKSKAPRRGKK